MATTDRIDRDLSDVVYLPVDATLVYYQGDLCYFDSTSGKVLPYSSHAWDTDLATTLSAAIPKFVGVCMENKPANGSSASGNSTQLHFKLYAEVTYLSTSAAYTYGSYVTLAKQSGNALERAKVNVTTTAGHSLGLSTTRATTTSVSFRLTSNLFPLS